MVETAIDVVLELDETDDPRALASLARELGAHADVEEQKGVLPLPVLVVLALPAVALLAKVVTDMVRSSRPGLIIDARGKSIRIRKERELPFGTVVVLTKDGDQMKRTDLPVEHLGDFVAKVVGAVVDGASASAAVDAAGAS